MNGLTPQLLLRMGRAALGSRTLFPWALGAPHNGREDKKVSAYQAKSKATCAEKVDEARAWPRAKGSLLRGSYPRLSDSRHAPPEPKVPTLFPLILLSPPLAIVVPHHHS